MRPRSLRLREARGAVAINGRTAYMGERRPLKQAPLARLDLQREVLRVDAALRQAAGDEIQPRLLRADEHVAQLLAVAEPPDRTDARRDILAEQFGDQVL